MSVFNNIPMGQEGLSELYAWIEDFVIKNPGITEKKVLGRSEDGKWGIPAIIVTNKSIKDDDKQIAMLTLARHGQERGARVVGPGILNYLASDEAGETRSKQKVIVVPIANPEGFVRDEFNSSMYGITNLEKRIWGELCANDIPDMMIDYHSLGKSDATKYDRGDMEAIIPANITKWGMDEQIYQHIANRMLEAVEAKGWPYEIHTLEDLSFYYFGDGPTARLPHRYLQEKVFLLHLQNTYEHYDKPLTFPGYTNYTCGPAYMKWHTLIFGIETNHWSIKPEDGLEESGLIPCQALLNMGNSRFSWEKDTGYPTNLICGDFRISIRTIGKTPGQRRISRERLWPERFHFDILKREMLEDPEITLAEVGYMGEKVPLDFALCLRMRQNVIKKVTVDNKSIEFETFKDHCSTFLYIPMTIQKPGLHKLTITHEAYHKKR
jgi:hypothetical protein